ncbi:MAG: hypothetical protein Q9220_007269 [cf. Caloplaca sp. 1 TL-2023]
MDTQPAHEYRPKSAMSDHHASSERMSAEHVADKKYERPPDYYVATEFTSRQQSDRLWTELFACIQQDGEPGHEYISRMNAIADQISDTPSYQLWPFVFIRIKAGLRDPIKKVLNAQIMQPNSQAVLNDVIRVIEHDLDQEHWHDAASPRPHLGSQLAPTAPYEHPQRSPTGPSEAGQQEDYPERLQILGHSQVHCGIKRKERTDDDQTDYQGSSLRRRVDNGGFGNNLPHHDRRRRKDNGVYCYTCGRPGHVQKQCSER